MRTYERVSDQLLYKDKSYFMVTTNTVVDIIDLIKEETGFIKKESPIVFLGCPFYIGGQRIIYYSDVVYKVIKCVIGMKSKLLSFWGRITFV